DSGLSWRADCETFPLPHPFTSPQHLPRSTSRRKKETKRNGMLANMCNGSMRIMDSFHRILFVVFAFHVNLIASADRKFGCLFEDELCTPYEVCVNDGVFGRCQSIPVTEVYTYDMSPSGLLRLRTLLQKLSHRGL
ncbi:hypothetical protein AAFF_G00233750, partial [Aldrovandia affinis]